MTEAEEKRPIHWWRCGECGGVTAAEQQHRGVVPTAISCRAVAGGLCPGSAKIVLPGPGYPPPDAPELVRWDLVDPYNRRSSSTENLAVARAVEIAPLQMRLKPEIEAKGTTEAFTRVREAFEDLGRTWVASAERAIEAFRKFRKRYQEEE